MLESLYGTRILKSVSHHFYSLSAFSHSCLRAWECWLWRSCDFLFHSCLLFHSLCADDHNRVILAPLAGHDDCQRDYINACYVDVSVYKHSCCKLHRERMNPPAEVWAQDLLNTGQTLLLLKPLHTRHRAEAIKTAYSSRLEVWAIPVVFLS